ncbi:nuclear transport factor 2 family protein [Ruegeria sp. Ofav3-42]|uniref:nuclear transport factor 2 family protein n=1 Tax=Ruegeria sp. Ofav3-42 TaxID=2917759 RepID=UPI001EF4B49F|nr:nuclear transport factor 2 family protein [Ruegeria sp. Ofav3-42]MCG7521039.1 nuclear transport factor 2 family protein [Ruegeria sp. Ofav3-42]
MSDKDRIDHLARQYLQAIESGDISQMLSLFSNDATATSPISGKQQARDFYTHVMKITKDRSTVHKNTFADTSSALQMAVHFDYTRIIHDGHPETIECVDLFELTEDQSRFKSVTIIYDTAPVLVDIDEA